MGISLRSRIALASLSATLLWLSLTASASFAATSSTNSFESAGVREELSHELQSPGPTIVSQGGSGGTGASPAPAGTLVPSLSSAYSDTWSEPGQPLVKRIYAVPVNYKSSDGSWKAINNELISSPLGGYENAANSFTLRLPESLSSGVSLSDGAGSVSFTLRGAADSLPSVSGYTASYAEALPSTDVSYVSLSSGVQEVVSLKNSEAPAELRYSLSLPAGISPRSEADGSIALVNGEGDALFAIPAATAFRPTAGPDSGRVLPTTVTASGAEWELTVDTGEEWLREELSSGPVAVDPTVDVSGAQACSLAAESPTTSKCSSSELRVGYDSTHQENHALLGFNVSELPIGYEIINAKLGLYVTAHSTSTAKAVGVYRVTKPWTTSATWNTYDGTHSWSTPGGDYSNPETDSDASVNTSVGASTGWYYWYPTKLVQEWVNTAKAPEYEKHPEGYANEGLIVKDQTDNATQNLLSIDSPWASSDQPYLEIYYRARGVGVEPQYTIDSTDLTSSSTMGVNIASGDLLLQSQQLETPGIAGFGISSERTWNGRNGEQEAYGHWEDSNKSQLVLHEYPNGSVSYQSATGAVFGFEKQSNGSFITPAGIKANMCAAGSPSPCPTSLPSGITHELIFDQSQERIEYNSSGVGVKEEDRYGNTITLEDPSETRAILTDAQGHKVEQLSGGPDGYVSEIKDLTGSRSVSFSYKDFEEGEPELHSYTDADGNVTSYEYSNYEISKITDPDGNVTLFHYDSDRRVSEIIRTTNSGHTEGPTTKFKYYEPGEAPSPCTSNQRGTLVKDPDWTSEHEHETLYCSNVLDEVEKTVRYNKTEKLESGGTYNVFGDQATLAAAAPGTGESGAVTSLNYGTGGVNLACSIEGTTKEESSCPTSRPDSSALVTSYSYTQKAAPYSASQVEDPQNNSIYGCYNDGEQEPLKTGEPECPKSTTGPAGSPETETDGLSAQKELKFEYNTNGTIKAATDADGHKTTYEYDEKGNLKTVLAPSGSRIDRTTVTVDTDSRPHTVAQCLAESEGSCTLADTDTITYNNDNQVVERVYTGPGATKTYKYKYNGDGDIESVEQPGGTQKYTYDALNRLTEEALGSASVAYKYDAASNLTEFTDEGGTSRYFYNGLNQLESMYEPGGKCSGTPSKCTKFTYDGDGGLTKVTYPSGATLTDTLEGATERPTAITVKSPSGTTLLSNTYGYEKGADDTQLIYEVGYSQGSVSDTTKYAYDALNRLEEATTTGTYPSFFRYTLDGAGNRTAQKVNTSGSSGGTESFLRYNAGNELECRTKTNEACSKSSSTELAGYEYGGGGAELSITGYGEAGNTAFSTNNLRQIQAITPPSSGEQQLGYLGIGQSDLVGIGSIELQNTRLGLTLQSNASGTSYYARTPEGMLVDERLPSGSDYNPVYDANGDVIGLLNSGGELVQTVRYGPYGENAEAAGSLSYSATNDPFLFQGGYHLAGGDAGSGNIPNDLYHFGERYYEPTTGRWTQEDPARHVGSASQADAYGFLADDPVNQADPDGEVSKLACWLVSVSLACGAKGDEHLRSSPFYSAESQSAYEERPTETQEPVDDDEAPDDVSGGAEAGDDGGVDLIEILLEGFLTEG